MTDTPRTDEHRFRCIMTDCSIDCARLLERENKILLAALEGVARRGSPLAREALIAVGKLRKEHNDPRRTPENA